MNLKRANKPFHGTTRVSPLELTCRASMHSPRPTRFQGCGSTRATPAADRSGRALPDASPVPFARLRCAALRCVSYGSYALVLNAHARVRCARPQRSGAGPALSHAHARELNHQKVLAGVERDVLDQMRVGADLVALLHRRSLRGCASVRPRSTAGGSALAFACLLVRLLRVCEPSAHGAAAVEYSLTHLHYVGHKDRRPVHAHDVVDDARQQAAMPRDRERRWLNAYSIHHDTCYMPCTSRQL
jgi:hypothetical protein